MAIPISSSLALLPHQMLDSPLQLVLQLKLCILLCIDTISRQVKCQSRIIYNLPNTNCFFSWFKAGLIALEAMVKELAKPIQTARGAQQACLEMVGAACGGGGEGAVVTGAREYQDVMPRHQ